jgi:hypothetical protein
MNELTLKIQELANRCQAILDAMRSPDVHARSPSPKTKIAYERQAQQLLQRTRTLKVACLRSFNQQPVLPHFANAW